MKVAYVSLGCPKNVSDLENILGSLEGHVEIVSKPELADLTLINTCSFIESAKREAVDTILEAIQLKSSNPEHKVVVTGCLPQRYQRELVAELPEVDLFIPFTDIHLVSKSLFDFIGKKYSKVIRKRRITPAHYGYLKIAQGCNNRCSYCAIPNIKGNYKGFAPDLILEQAEVLAQSGVKELIVVAQDTTYYGQSGPAGHSLVKLLHTLHSIKEFQWIRLMYTHPAHWSDRLLETIAELDKIVKYIDLPVQHISDRLLKQMGRRVSRRDIERLIEKLRSRIPDIALRTSVIVGFPGETEAEFEELAEFVAETRFERLGAFAYSQEEGTKAASLEDDISDPVKLERQNRIMKLQTEIALANNQRLVNSQIPILIDEVDSENVFSFGRTQWDAPEIDNTVVVAQRLKPGSFYQVHVDSADCYDLMAHCV